MKKNVWLTALLAMLFLLSAAAVPAQAEIIPPFGEGQIGLQAVVLCDRLTVYQEPNEASPAVQTLEYRALISVTEQSNGWARCVIGDAEDAASGWVKADYIVVDPAWYRTDAKTPVYAWKDAAAPKVALLEANTVFFDMDTFLPILKTEGDWILVSLRGAAGWICVGGGRQDGEQFEKTILLEGMEETVRYEHAANSAGFELDYEYESLLRYSEENREVFISRWDDLSNPENYLIVEYHPADADSTVAAVRAALSNDYDITVESCELNGAGSCVRIDASQGTLLRTVYVIPAADGSIVAEAHYTLESAEGFGARFNQMVQGLTVTGGQR